VLSSVSFHTRTHHTLLFHPDWQKRISECAVSEIALMGQKTISFATVMTTMMMTKAMGSKMV
jgi:hypothetical protein